MPYYLNSGKRNIFRWVRFRALCGDVEKPPAVSKMKSHRVCTALHLCASAPFTLAYVSLTVGAALALTNTVLREWVKPVGLDRTVAIVACAVAAPLAAVSIGAACAVTRRDGRCRSARLVAAHGALTSVLFAFAAFATGVLSAVAASLLSNGSGSMVLSHLVDAGCAAADTTCCVKYPSAFSCAPVRAACEAQNEVNGTLTLRDFFVDAVEQSRYFVWGGSGVFNADVADSGDHIVPTLRGNQAGKEV